MRPGEGLAADALGDYLRRRLPAAGVEVAANAPLEVLQFPSGWSNLTYLLRLGELEMVLRRPPFGNRVASAHDMSREYRVLAALAPVWELAPRPWLLCEDATVLGAPFYVMERRRGLVLRQRPPPELALGPARARALSGALAEALAGLHRFDYTAAGLGDLGRPRGYVRRQVEGWSRRYRRAQTDEQRAIDEVIAWLAARLPADADGAAAALVHNDFKYDNLVLDPEDPTRLRAVLDWEMATVGHPLMDLGTTLGYWVEAGDPQPLRDFAMGPTALPGSLGRRALAERYAAAAGDDLGDLVFFYVFGLFKIAVIVQQIHARWRAGTTCDPRFAGLHRVVALLGGVAVSAAERESVEPP